MLPNHARAGMRCHYRLPRQVRWQRSVRRLVSREGAGNPGPAYPTLGGQHSAYVSARLTAFRGGLVLGKGDYANPVMAGVAKNLTDEEIQALATYVNGLHPAQDDVADKKLASAAPAAAPASNAAAPHPIHQH